MLRYYTFKWIGSAVYQRNYNIYACFKIIYPAFYFAVISNEPFDRILMWFIESFQGIIVMKKGSYEQSDEIFLTKSILLSLLPIGCQQSKVSNLKLMIDIVITIIIY